MKITIKEEAFLALAFGVSSIIWGFWMFGIIGGDGAADLLGAFSLFLGVAAIFFEVRKYFKKKRK
jgi:hypothetical protein